MRVSQTHLINLLSCAIGPLLAWDLWWVLRYWPTIVSLWGDALRWSGYLEGLSR